jgi:DNA repair protein RadC
MTPETRENTEADLLTVARARVRVALIQDPAAPYSGILHDAEAVHALLGREAASWDRERLLTLMLDPSNRLIGIEEVSVGTVSTAPVHPREIFKALILANATSFICVHNHPSGDPAPSQCDIEVTLLLEQAGRILGIKLLDHIVIAAGGYRSLREQGLWRPRVEEPRVSYGPRVPLGNVCITPNALRTLETTDILRALGRHSKGDWGDVDEADRWANDGALKAGGRLLSSYRSAILGLTFWVITEADRSMTTVLLPADY